MNLSKILDYIKSLFEADGRLSDVSIADVYNHWNNSETKYMSAVIDFQNSNFNGDYVDYSFLVYVGTVIREDEKNIYQAFSITDNIIQNVLHKIDTDENNMDLVAPDMIQPFRQQFQDVLAGCFATFQLRVPIDIICENE